MRVVLVGPAYPFRGGIAHYTTLLALHLADRHDLLLLSFVEQYPKMLFPGRTDRDPSEAAVKVEADRLLAPLRPWTWLRAASRAAAFEPDIVLLQWWVPFWAPCLAAVASLIHRRCEARVLFICHNVLPHDSDGVVTRALTRLALARGDGFIVHSQADEATLGELLQSGAGRINVRRTPLPEFGIGADADRRQARHALGLDEGDQVALFFGFVRPYKGLSYLIEAMPVIRERLPHMRLIVAGEFWGGRDQYDRRIEELDLVSAVRIDDRYVPNEDVGGYFAAADVVVLPYTSATQSAVVTLASRFERPVITTSVGGLPDVVLDGRTGLVVAPEDAPALAAAVIRFFTEEGLGERLSSGVRETRDRFDWDHLEAVIVSFADSVAGDNR